MRNDLFKRYLVFGVIILFFGLTVGPVVNSIGIENKQMVSATADNDVTTAVVYGYTDITVQDAWSMLNNISDGIQIPIDVRTDGEWENERIDTPYPENPRHYCLSDLENENGLQEFMSLYSGKEIIIYCRSGSRSSAATHILDENGFDGAIYNMLGGITAWKGAGYPTKLGNMPPYQPDKPSGPVTVAIGIIYTYFTTAIDPDNDTVKYGWDWNGDDIADDWTDYNLSGVNVSISHLWDTAGTYNITAIAEDGVGGQSDFSSALTVTVAVNNPPDKPRIDGHARGKAGVGYTYTFSTVDPDGNDIYYIVDWGDNTTSGWVGPYSSNEEINMSHTWEGKGVYTVKIKAKDTLDAESDWATLVVSMPRCKQLNNPVLSMFLEKHLYIFSVLRYLLEL